MVARVLPRSDYAGGVSGQVHLLATALVERGHDVTVFSLTSPPPAAAYRWQEVRAGRRTDGALALYRFPIWVARLGFEGYDLVHTHGDDHLLRAPCPVVRTFYGSAQAEARHSERWRHRVYYASMAVLERVSERRATRLTVISASTQRYLGRPAEHIPCGYDPTTFFPAGDRSRSPSILFVGDLGTRKRAGLLLDVFARVVKPAVPGAELWMVTSESIEAPGVSWLGRLSTADLVDRYQRAWVFCLPSRYEGFGVPYIEAMACATPVVATPNGGAEEILDGGLHGRLVQDDALGGALVELLRSEESRDLLGERGVRRAKDYDIAVIAERYECAYREAIAR